MTRCDWPVRPWLGAVLVIGTMLFALIGVLFGPLPGQDVGLGGAVIPQAHLFGVIGGLVFLLLRQFLFVSVPHLSPRIGYGQDSYPGG